MAKTAKRDALESLIAAGIGLSNAAFNLSQPAWPCDSAARASLSVGRKEWDEALRTYRKAERDERAARRAKRGASK